jgi:hypothetical protein
MLLLTEAIAVKSKRRGEFSKNAVLLHESSLFCGIDRGYEDAALILKEGYHVTRKFLSSEKGCYCAKKLRQVEKNVLCIGYNT